MFSMVTIFHYHLINRLWPNSLNIILINISHVIPSVLVYQSQTTQRHSVYNAKWHGMVRQVVRFFFTIFDFSLIRYILVCKVRNQISFFQRYYTSYLNSVICGHNNTSVYNKFAAIWTIKVNDGDCHVAKKY